MAGERRGARRVLRLSALALPLSLLLINCSAVPRDSAGTLDRARGGVLRVGVAHHPPWVRLDDDRVEGIEAELTTAWADELGARVTWRRGAEAELVEALHRRELDLVAAGFDSGTPHRKKLALTQPYLEIEDRHGSSKGRVLAVMPGESALLLSLDRFLATQDRESLRRRAADAMRP